MEGGCGLLLQYREWGLWHMQLFIIPASVHILPCRGHERDVLFLRQCKRFLHSRQSGLYVPMGASKCVCPEISLR